MRLLICGDRNWTDRNLIMSSVITLSAATDIEVIIQGVARGADLLGRSVAEELGIPVLSYPALWRKYGKSAGYRRNSEMLSKGKPDHVIAFHSDIQHSKGTKHMVNIALDAGIPVTLIG